MPEKNLTKHVVVIPPNKMRLPQRQQQVHHPTRIRTPIYIIAHKNQLRIRVRTPNPLQQSLQRLNHAMDVANDPMHARIEYQPPREMRSALLPRTPA